MLEEAKFNKLLLDVHILIFVRLIGISCFCWCTYEALASSLVSYKEYLL